MKVYNKPGVKIADEFNKSLNNEQILFNSEKIKLTFRGKKIKAEGLSLSSYTITKYIAGG